MRDASYEFLKRLLSTPGPSGNEGVAARVWREEAGGFAELRGDRMGNSFATLNPGGSPKVMLSGHIDEIGLIVTHIDEKGLVRFTGVGGWDPQVLVGQRVRIQASDGEVMGVIGKKAIHVMEPEERKKVSEIKSLWIDIGARDGDEADRKSTRLNSSHANISYAVFCLKKKTPPRSAECLPTGRAPYGLTKDPPGKFEPADMVLRPTGRAPDWNLTQHNSSHPTI